MEDQQRPAARPDAPTNGATNGARARGPGPEISRKVLVRLLDPRGGDSVHELTELLHRAYKRHADRGMRAIAAFQDDMTTVKRITGGECYVAVLRDDERRIVGTIVFKDAAHTKGTAWFDHAGVASFSQLAVEPWLQGRGIGGMLIRRAESRALETGSAEIALSTPEPATELLAMYAHKGYRTVDHMNWPGTNYRSVIMSKAVGAVSERGAETEIAVPGTLPRSSETPV